MILTSAEEGGAPTMMTELTDLFTLNIDATRIEAMRADVTTTLDVLGVYTSRLRNNEGATMPTQQRDKTRKHFKI